MPAVLAVVAIGDMPYGYYQFVRVAVCVACTFLADLNFQSSRSLGGWVILLIATALLFNPIAPVHLSKAIWRWLDGLAAMALIGRMIFVRVLERPTN